MTPKSGPAQNISSKTAGTNTGKLNRRIVFDTNLKSIFYFVLPLLLIPPFFRGLFFDFEADLAHIYTALVFAAVHGHLLVWSFN